MSRVDRKPVDEEVVPQRFNFQTGRLGYRLRGSLDTEFNDNINVSEVNPQSDVIFWPKIGVDGFLPITELNTLDFGVGIGYQKFVDHGEYDQFYIAPKSHLNFHVLVGSVRLELYDEVSFVQDPTREGQISGNAKYGGFENAAGLAATWRINERLQFSLGFDYFIFISSVDEFSVLDRTTKSFPANLSYVFSEIVTGGLQLYPARTDYEEWLLTPHWQVSAGFYANVHVSEHLVVRPEFGVATFLFDRATSSGMNESHSVYYAIELEHTVNERWRYSLSVGRDTMQGIFGSLLEMFHGRLKVAWRANDHIVVRPALFWEDAQDEIGGLGENYWRLGVEPRAEFFWLENWSFSASYRLTLKRSDRQFRDYDQNRFLATFAYTF